MRQVSSTCTPSPRTWVTLALLLSAVAAPRAQLLGPLSDEEEIAVGWEAAAAIEAELVLLDDDTLTTYIEELEQSVARQSGRPTLTYRFRIVDSPEINAFALPGGFIYVNRDLIEAAASEADVVGVSPTRSATSWAGTAPSSYSGRPTPTSV